MKEIYFKVTKYCLLFVLIMANTSTFAQQTITGKVTDATGQGIPSTTVLVKGTKNGTSTNPSGTYSIKINKGEVLLFSLIGYLSQEITIQDQTTVNVKLLEDSKGLDEVVVVGYGTQNRRSVTSSISKLDKEVLANTPRSNAASALQGTVPGLQVVTASGQPGAAPSILLRGGASINSPGAPLVIVDGVIRSLSDISSENIESIETLKDASATAIYGARANNGVILVTTKTGKAGSAQISYKFTGGYNQERKGYQYMGAGDYIYYTRLGYLNAGRTLAQVNGARGLGLSTNAADLASFDIKTYIPGTTVLPSGWQLVNDPYGGQIMYKDHGGEIEDLVFQNTYTKDHYVSASGGNDKGKYFAAFDAYNENGVIVGSKYKRYTGDINGSYKIKPNVEISSGVTLSTSSQLGTIGGEVNTLYRSLAIWPTFNPWIDEAKTVANPGNSTSDGNPLYWLGRLDRSNEINRIVANAAVKWDIIPGLYFKATGNAYLYETLDQSFQKSTQTYAQIFANSGSSTTRSSSSAFGRDFQTQFNGILNYTKSFGKHNLNLMGGAEYFDVKSYASQILGQNAPTDDIPTANASTTFAAGSNFTTRTEYKILSAFSRFAYDFDQKYLFTAVFRLDGASSLASENRNGIFPGVSAGWNVHREEFFKNSKVSQIISSLKPRVSYGQNGNIAGLGRYETQGVYSLQGNYNGSAGFLNTGIINKDLRWEKSKTTDLGLDMGLLKDRITVIFDYYDRKTSDLLTNLDLPSYTGFSSFRTNLGTFQNKGVEIGVDAKIIDNGGFKFNVGANASFVKNKILKLPFNGNENNRQGGLQIYDPAYGKVIWVGGLQEGQPLGNMYGYKQVSIFKDAAEVAAVAGNRTDAIAGITGPNLPAGANGRITPGDVNWEDVNEDNIIDTRDQVYLGNIYPKWTGGFNLNASYKGFGFYNRWDFALGHTIYNDLVARTLGNYQGTFNYIDLQAQAWSPTNTDTDIPKVYYADQVAGSKQNYTRANNGNVVLNGNNSRLYEKGDYLCLREITLSYNLPKELLQQSKFLNNARIYVTGSNLLYITKFSGPSPEPPVSGTTITGIYSGTYPTPRTFIMGIQVGF
ncbi:SusC/RagA family TonB-linked outer membrane protein [Pedobacter sp. Leaf216]|uniref:SusC/RagA family TonB-linked outer membrane protein n=1 Tax=Pedobacter sp. Leaf216 TaxID=1735684 RepID=UPI0006F70B64|nr:TonB-dependent receptor [Pedobacter sp. Leaf216]KQM69641.1 SusC/RagA family TonB-linked outer membrane protein [Pedobacter sp. Leaf216]